MVWQYEGESDWEAMKRRRKERFERLENDFEHRMKEVDMKLDLVNAFAGFAKYKRYKTDVYEHDRSGALIDEYQIGIHGEVRKYK